MSVQLWAVEPPKAAHSSSGTPHRKKRIPSRLRILRSAVAGQIVELYQFVDDLFAFAAGNAFGDAAMQMAFDKQRLQLLYRLTHRVGLAQDIHAILILFDHFANTAQVPFDIIESLENLLFIGLHRLVSFHFPYPPGGGIAILYHRVIDVGKALPAKGRAI